MTQKTLDGSKWTPQLTVIAVLLGAAFLTLIAVSASGVRGSDQYWYVADVETLVNGLPRLTNQYFAPFLLGEGDYSTKGAPFVHNSLGMYLVIPAAKVMGAFGGWVSTNAIATIATSVLIGYVVFRCTRSAPLSLVAGGAYAFIPLTMWQTSQPLVEATVAPFLAAAMAIYVCSTRSLLALSLLAITLGLGYWSRSSVLILLPLVPLAAWFDSDRSRRDRAIASAVTLGLICLFVVLQPKLFEQSMPGSIRAVLANGANGGSNGDFMYALGLPFPSWRELLTKILGAWHAQFLDFSQLAVFYLPFNVLALMATAALLRYRTTAAKRLAWCALALLGMHFLTISIHQNQFRYLLLPLPTLIACCCVSYAGWIQRHRSQCLALGVLVLLGAVGLDGLLATRLHKEGHAHLEQRRALSVAVAKNVGAEDALVYCLRPGGQQFAYTIRPRRFLYVYENYPEAVYRELARRLRADWVVCPPNSPVLAAYGLTPSARVSVLPSPFTGQELYRLPRLQ